jgi:long-chain-fatty-acyl-CoA reductase
MDDVRETLDIPMIINGRRIQAAERDRLHLLDYENGMRVRMPVMLPEDLDEIVKERPKIGRALARLTTDELTMWDTIAAELGNERIFDEWIPRQMVYVRAFARGLLVQYLVGNLPLAGMYTVLRGIISRNVNVLKLPSRDPVTVLGLVESMLEIDPEHPVSRALSVVYWPHAARIGEACLRAADAVCVWGGADAVETVKRAVRANVPVSEYGPRWSASVIDLTRCDPDEAALRLVDDVGFYDQEACFNTQRAFVRGDVAEFRIHLRKYLDHFAKRFPLTSNRDSLAHRSSTLAEARYLELDVDEGPDWAIVTIEEDKDPGLVHPLTRTIFLHHVSNFDTVSQYLNGHSQTISVMPWKLIDELRDELAMVGANRFVELGWSRLPRQGFTHDGVYGMHSLVRLVALERSRDDFGKYYIKPLETKTWSRPYILGERWWTDPWWTLVDRNVAETGR